jgi:iron complex transport system substrate-binding protein
MKKTILFVMLLLAMLFTLTGCGGDTSAPAATEAPTTETPAVAEDAEFVTITDFYGNVVEVQQNPSTVAIFDLGVLDMLNTIGFENTSIETLILPTLITLPDSLAWLWEDNNTDINVLTGGTLFYIDHDILDLVDPDLVILGVRSFFQNTAGERLSDEDMLEFQEETMTRYSDTSFVWLTIDSHVSHLTRDMRRNVASLSLIFPDIAGDLATELADIEREWSEIAAITSASELQTAFVMMVDPSRMSVFLDGSRFGFLFDEFGFIPLNMDLDAWTDQHGFEMQSEFLLEQNPDVIFLLDRTDPSTGLGGATENFMNDSIIQQTNAFINGHIYSGLPMTDWYTVVGGFASARRMIADVNRFIDNFEFKQ